jgi:hypothetical protein
MASFGNLFYLTAFFGLVVRSNAQTTANNSQLVTWWHDTGVVNTQTTVDDSDVRQSGIYEVQVATGTSQDGTFYDSFVYNVIPANGMSNELQYATSYSQTQAWSSFLYTTDVTVKVTRNGTSTSSGDIIIRPTNLDFSVSYADDSAYITVPYSSHGYRFSVEFNDDLISLSPSGAMQPANALLIFASPFEDSSLVPTADSSAVIPGQGRVLGLDTTSASTVIFYPGVYYFTGTDHMILSDSVTWVYFAPGAYVKGAVEFLSTASEIKATGHGVLSGEQYVWYADPDQGYQTSSGATNNGLRMWRGTVGSSSQTFLLNGPTISAAPFNTMDWSGDDLNLITCLVTDYKQVGSFYGQTDGLEMYPGSVVQDVFYHTNDDTIKMYYSNVIAQNIVVWKLAVAPVVQFGWTPRNTENVTIDTVSVIHQGYQGADNNPGLFGSDNNYLYAPYGLSANHNTANSNLTTQNIVWSNFRAEGPSASLFRIYSLENLANIKIENVWIEEFEPSSLNTTQSWLPAFYDVNNGKQVTISNFVISGFSVGSTTITADNAASVGLIDIDTSYTSDVSYQ